MRAEVIAIGDELTTGQRLDTNTQWLSERLTDLGVEVAFHTTIGDRLADNTAAFRAAIDRADVVVCTGGLGPTADDLTRDAIATATGTQLEFHEPSFAHIRRLFELRGREMVERNRVQAMFPEGSTPIPNEHGTAPGIEMRIARPCCLPCLVFALPGVPYEMRAMWEESVAPAITSAQPTPRVTVHRRIKCFGAGESQLEAMVPDLIARQREPIVGITVSSATITLRITASGQDEAAARASIVPTEDLIREKLGDLVFGVEDDELEHAVAKLLHHRGETVAVAEWATAGLVGRRLALAPHADSACLGFVSGSSARQFQRLLPVSIEGFEPEDAGTAVALAEGVRKQSGATYGLGIAAYPQSVAKPEDRLCIAVAGPDRTHKLRFSCGSHPSILESRSAKQALNALRLLLLKA
ncbi:MAG: CinA family nicotinamide mononucleotide deamidase-related protein [Planctomycetota bacterium]